MSSQFWRDPLIPQIIESRRACHSRVCYKAHSHPSYSIGAIDAGRSVFRASHCGEYHLQAGQLILIPAEQQHSCNPLADQAWSYQMLHLDAQWLDTSHQSLTMINKHPLNQVLLISEPQHYQKFCQFNRLLFSTQPIFLKQMALYTLLYQLFSGSDASHASNTQRLLKASTRLIAFEPHFQRCHQAIQQQALLSLDDLAQMTALSCFQIIRLFRAYTGFSPHHFQLNLRINRARELLQQQQPLSEIAYQLNFADQSHFQRTFKAFVGVTPRQYQSTQPD